MIKNILLTFLFCAVAGCSVFSGSGDPLSELEGSSANSEESYRINAGDTLLVEIWGEPRLSGETPVRQDGKITLALINEILAEGKTVTELASDITTRMGEFIPSVSVTVSVTHTAPIRYYLSGLFAKPAEYRSDSRISFIQAIATGGGFAPFADDSNVLLIRKYGDTEKRYRLNYNKVISGGQPNPEIKNGDVISVN